MMEPKVRNEIQKVAALTGFALVLVFSFVSVSSLVSEVSASHQGGRTFDIIGFPIPPGFPPDNDEIDDVINREGGDDDDDDDNDDDTAGKPMMDDPLDLKASGQIGDEIDDVINRDSSDDDDDNDDDTAGRGDLHLKNLFQN